MGLLFPTLPAVLLLLLFLFGRPQASADAQPAARALDFLLQDYAYRSFVHPRTGIVYDAKPPANLTRVEVSVMQLRTGSLRKKGVTSYKEFHIPKGIVEQPYVKRLALVYHNLANWLHTYYPLPGYTYLAPVLGLLVYDTANLSATNLSELDMTATGDPISITFSDMRSSLDGSVPKCVFFDLSGSPSFSIMVKNNVCSTTQQGHFSIVVESIAPALAPFSPAPPSPGGAPPAPRHREKKKSHTKTVWIIVGSVVGGVLLLSLLAFLILWLFKLRKRSRMRQMEWATEVGESLHMASVGETRAPTAISIRTQPTLENEYVP